MHRNAILNPIIYLSTKAKFNSSPYSKEVSPFMPPILFFFACHGSSFPLGTWRLSGDNELGFIRHSKSTWSHTIELAIFTEHASTNGVVEASLDSQDGIHWLRFPIETGLNWSSKPSPTGSKKHLPMGARVNEFGLRMTAQKRGLSEEESIGPFRWAVRQAADRRAWIRGLLCSTVRPPCWDHPTYSRYC